MYLIYECHSGIRCVLLCSHWQQCSSLVLNPELLTGTSHPMTHPRRHRSSRQGRHSQGGWNWGAGSQCGQSGLLAWAGASLRGVADAPFGQTTTASAVRACLHTDSLSGSNNTPSRASGASLQVHTLILQGAAEPFPSSCNIIQPCLTAAVLRLLGWSLVTCGERCRNRWTPVKSGGQFL